MQRIPRIPACLVVALVATGVGARANDDELTLRNKQLVITRVTPNCEAGPAANTLLVEGRNIGGNAPHVTLGLREVTAGAPSAPDPITGNQIFTVSWNPATVFDFCGNPASYLLTVLRTMNHPKHRNLQPNRNDLDVFDATIAGDADADGITQEQLDEAIVDHTAMADAHHARYTDAEAANAAQPAIAAAVGAHAADLAAHAAAIGNAIAAHVLALPHLSLVDVLDNVAASITDPGGVVRAAIDPLLGGGGGAGGSTTKVYYVAAECRSGAASNAWDHAPPAGGGSPAPSCSNNRIQRGVATFTEVFPQRAAKTAMLPSDWTGDIDIVLYWSTAVTDQVKRVRWVIETKCGGDGDPEIPLAPDPIFNAPQVILDAPKATPNALNTATLDAGTHVTTNGCAQGDLFTVAVSRDHTHADDTLGASANLFGMELTMRRSTP